MEILLSFLEELDAPACVTDLETHELIFLNRRLRECLGLHSGEDMPKKPCYQLLRGRMAPCPSCQKEERLEGQLIQQLRVDPTHQTEILYRSVPLTFHGRRCRVEMAVELPEQVKSIKALGMTAEDLLWECFQTLFASTDPESSLELTMAYLGDKFHCTRVNIFELEEEGLRSSYEWCRSGVSVRWKQRETMDRSRAESWLDLFRECRCITIADPEELRETRPEIYAAAKSMGLQSMAAGALNDGGRLCGFFTAEDPDRQLLPLLAPMMDMLGYFLSALLKGRDLYHQLNVLSYRDMLTGAYNRNALYAHDEGYSKMQTLGVLYCDINGLKQVNDTQGHNAGDEMIRRCCDLIRQTLSSQWIYRIGGDEFLAVYPNVSREELKEEEKALRSAIAESGVQLAVGRAWSDQSPLHPESLISQADGKMYRDKQAFYQENWKKNGAERRRCVGHSSNGIPRTATPLDRFLSATHYDISAFFNAMSQDNSSSYFFFGDVQKNAYYISNNLRDKFGFSSNFVPGLLQVWPKRIVNAQDKERYWASLRKIREEKGSVHDLRYPVWDASGRSVWVRCYGLMKWDEARETPLFFSGRVTQQDEDFVVDPMTNFPKESVMIRHLEGLEEKDLPCLVIGFSFNGIHEINTTRGRACSNRLAREIADGLEERLFGQMSFYRLDGMRCAALVDADCTERPEVLIRKIREVIEECYLQLDIPIRQACSFALMHYRREDLPPMDFLAALVALIRKARQTPEAVFIEDYRGNLQQNMRQMSRMVLGLNQDVMENMQHFRVMIQPVVSARTGKIVGGETLLRWTFEGADIPPSEFVSILEKENMIQDTGRWVFAESVRVCAEIQKIAPGVYLTVNVSRRQLNDTALPAHMHKTLKEYQLDGRHLVVEMTESCMDGRQGQLLRFTESCENCGIRIALDDFGTGYSSIHVLLRCPSSIVKLDRSLMLEMEETPEKMDFVSSIVYACHRFGKQVCMEGVESREQNELACRAGCDLIQGFYYHRPMEVSAFLAALAEERKDDSRKAEQ